MAEHTPGPWTVHREQSMCSQSFMVLGAPQRDERYPTLTVQVVPEVARFTKINDALLIAAAPELLAAAQMIIETCPCDNDLTLEFDTAWRLLKQAIQSASGSPEDAE